MSVNATADIVPAAGADPTLHIFISDRNWGFCNENQGKVIKGTVKLKGGIRIRNRT